MRALWGAAAVAVLGVAAVFGYRYGVVAARQLADVHVTWDGPIRCAGTEVYRARTGPGGSPVTSMRLRKGMACTLPVRVTNGGDHPVRVDKVRLPFMGPSGGAAVQVRQLAGRTPVGARKRWGPTDAIFPLNRTLGPGGHLSLTLRFEFRPGGCTSALTWVGGMPTVTVTALGRTGARLPRQRIGFGPSPDSHCPR